MNRPATPYECGADDGLQGLDEPSREFRSVTAFREWFAGWKAGKAIAAQPKRAKAAPQRTRRRQKSTQPWELRRAEYLRNKRL